MSKSPTLKSLIPLLLVICCQLFPTSVSADATTPTGSAPVTSAYQDYECCADWECARNESCAGSAQKECVGQRDVHGIIRLGCPANFQFKPPKTNSTCFQSENVKTCVCVMAGLETGECQTPTQSFRDLKMREKEPTDLQMGSAVRPSEGYLQCGLAHRQKYCFVSVYLSNEQSAVHIKAIHFSQIDQIRNYQESLVSLAYVNGSKWACPTENVTKTTKIVICLCRLTENLTDYDCHKSVLGSEITHRSARQFPLSPVTDHFPPVQSGQSPFVCVVGSTDSAWVCDWPKATTTTKTTTKTTTTTYTTYSNPTSSNQSTPHKPTESSKTTPENEKQNEDGGLSIGLIIAIALGLVLVLTLITAAIIIWYLMKRTKRRNRKRPKESNETTESTEMLNKKHKKNSDNSVNSMKVPTGNSMTISSESKEPGLYEDVDMDSTTTTPTLNLLRSSHDPDYESLDNRWGHTQPKVPSKKAPKPAKDDDGSRSTTELASPESRLNVKGAPAAITRDTLRFTEKKEQKKTDNENW